MKKLITLLFPLIVFALGVSAQSYSYEIKMENFQQIDETQFQWDISLRKGTGSNDFALYTMQLVWDFNNSIENTGAFQTADLTINSSGTGLFQKAGWFTDADFTVIGTTPNRQFNWGTTVAPAGGEKVTVIDATWRKVATFNAVLRKDGNLHNFADLDPMLAFQSTGTQVIVRRCDQYSGSNPNATMLGEVNMEVDKAGRVLTPALGVKVNERQLAGYCFTGTGNWNEPARWNNVTILNSNTIPPLATSNAIIAGTATATDARTVNQLTVATGGYLVLNQVAQLTSTNLYNDNSIGGSGVVTVAKWDFQDATELTNQYPYLADIGTIANNNIAPLTTTATQLTSFNFSTSGGTIAPRAQNWYSYDEDLDLTYYYSWVIQFSTSAYENLKLSSKQRSISTGPSSFKVQWSTNGTTWTDLSGGAVNVDATWTTGVLSGLTLPVELANKTIVYLRWLSTVVPGNGSSAIDDIVITGEALPTGILVQSTAIGTGSLIHNNTGVNATVERYIGAPTDWLTATNDGWHLLSSPVDGQAITDDNIWTPNDYATVDDYDFYALDETNTLGYEYWLNEKTSPNGANFTNFVNGKGYLVAYEVASDKLFAGTINTVDVPFSLTYSPGNPIVAHRGWNLAGNPFASALNWNVGSWTGENIDDVAQVWDEIAQSYVTTPDKGNIIPSMNGFMVHTSVNGAVLTIPAAARVHNSANWYKAGDENFILLKANDQENGSSQSSIVRFNAEATDGYDTKFDSYFLKGFAPQFYSVSGSESYALNTLPEMKDLLEIPFAFVKNGSGNFSIELAKNLPDAVVYLIDKKTGAMQNLSENPVYAFAAAEGDQTDRFILHFGSQFLGLNPSNANANFSVWYNKGDIQFSTLPEKVLSMSLIDMAGREIVSFGKPGSDKISVGKKLAPGYYLVRINMTDKMVTRKLFIN